MFVAEAVCFGGELEPKSGTQCGALVVPRVGVAGTAGIIAWSERGGKRVGVGLAGSEAGQGELSDQVPARSRSLAEVGSGNPQGSAQARPMLSQGPEGERTPCSSVRVTGPS